MCNATALVVTSILSTAMQVSAAQSQASFEKGKAKYNARVAENQAQATRDVGTEKENAQRLKTAQLIAQQKTEIGALNIDTASGSAFQLQQDTATLGEADALRIRSTTEAQSASLLTQAELTRSEGEYAQIAGRNKAFGSILKGASSIAGSGVSDKWFTPDSVAKIAPGQSFASTPIG